MPAAESLEALTNPDVPLYDPLAQASVPQAPVTIVTTAANGAHGSVDHGGAVDQIAAAANTPALSPFGIPWYAPSVAGALSLTTAKILGAFVGGFHGYKRTHKPIGALGYGLAGLIFLLPTLVVAAVQGYAKPRRR